MELNDKDVKRFFVVLIALVITILVFLLIKPILLSILAGLILAFVFFPLYSRILKWTKRKNLSASLVCLIIIIIIILPVYYFTPILINKIYELFQYFLNVDIQSFVRAIFPTAPDSFIIQTTVTLESVVNKMSSFILTFLVDLLLEVPTLLFHLAIVAFVFFYALKDSENLKEFTLSISPLSKTQEHKLISQFKEITNSIIYGQVIIGIIQGILAGLGFFVFGIPHALLLSTFAVFLSVIPILGPFLIWIPATFYLFAQGNIPITFLFILYNVIVVSQIDNILRIYFVSKKTQLSSVIVLIGMVGGLFFFGLLGLILGPLILAYFITFLNAYRENQLSSLFKPD